MSACVLRYVYSNIASIDPQTLKLIKISASPRTRTDVELPSAVWCRQTNPGLASLVDRVERGYEAGDARVIQWRDQPGDVVLCDVVSHRPSPRRWSPA